VELFILRAWQQHSPVESGLVVHGITLMRRGAAVMAAAQVAKLAMQAWLLAEAFQCWPFPAYFSTLQCQAGLSRALLAGGWAAAGLWLGRRPSALPRWIVAALLSVVLAASGAWLMHAVGHAADRSLLMAMTVLHQLGAIVWLGGGVQLGVLWRPIRKQPQLKPLWPVVLRRFAWVGGPAVLLLVVAGIPLAWKDIGPWQGLIETGYGTMVLIKMMLLATALGFAALNSCTSRDRHPTPMCPREWSHSSHLTLRDGASGNTHGSVAMACRMTRLSEHPQEMNHQRLAILEFAQRERLAVHDFIDVILSSTWSTKEWKGEAAGPVVCRQGDNPADGAQHLRRRVRVTMLGLSAEMEQELISLWTKEGLTAARAAGKLLSRPRGRRGWSKLDGREQEIIKTAGLDRVYGFHGENYRS
jgi:putative copper export protein